jgi:hypothetical protein
MRYVVRVTVVVVALYPALVAGLALAMRQPPDVFGSTMAKMPGQMFALLPFKSLWMHARAGALHAGDMAPDFALSSMNSGPTVRLSSLRGSPVVLIFGSYT